MEVLFEGPTATRTMMKIAIVMLAIGQSVGMAPQDRKMDGKKCENPECDPDFALKRMQADKDKKCSDKLWSNWGCHNGYRYGCYLSKCWKSAWNNETSRPNQYSAWYYWADPDKSWAYCSSSSSCLDDWKKLEEKLPGDQPCNGHGPGGYKKCQYGIRTWCEPIKRKNNEKYCVHTRNRAQKKGEIKVDITTREIRPKGETSWIKCEKDEDCDLTEFTKLDMRNPKLEYNWELDNKDATADWQVWQELVAIPQCISAGTLSEGACRIYGRVRGHHYTWLYKGFKDGRKIYDHCTCA